MQTLYISQLSMVVDGIDGASQSACEHRQPTTPYLCCFTKSSATAPAWPHSSDSSRPHVCWAPTVQSHCAATPSWRAPKGCAPAWLHPARAWLASPTGSMRPRLHACRRCSRPLCSRLRDGGSGRRAAAAAACNETGRRCGRASRPRASTPWSWPCRSPWVHGGLGWRGRGCGGPARHGASIGRSETEAATHHGLWLLTWHAAACSAFAPLVPNRSRQRVTRTAIHYARPCAQCTAVHLKDNIHCSTVFQYLSGM